MTMRQQFKTKFSPGHIDALYKIIYITPRAQKITNECIIKDRTYEDVGIQFGISRERVRQILNICLLDNGHWAKTIEREAHEAIAKATGGEV